LSLREITYRSGHFYRCLGTLDAAYDALFRLLLIFSTDDAKDHRDAGVQGDMLDTLSGSIAYNHVVARGSLHYTPNADERIIRPTSQQRLRYQWQLERSGCVTNVDILFGNSQVLQRALSLLEHGPCNVPVEASNHYADFEARSVKMRHGRL
jgi:hypothetical protein